MASGEGVCFLQDPLVMTTNCLLPPKDSYKDRVFTTGNVAFPGVKSVADRKDNGEKDFHEALPKDAVILTAGCVKYRYSKLNLGDIGEIPRIFDTGQCNDSYSLVLIALKLKEVFELEDINDLPIEALAKLS